MKYKQYSNYIKREAKRGYIALLSVIAISTIGVAVMFSVVLSGVNASRTDLAVQHAANAKIAASSCGEEALQRVLELGTTSSSGNLTLASSTCSYTITSQNGQNITINSTGVTGTVKSRVSIVIATTSPYVILSSWQEVGDF